MFYFPKRKILKPDRPALCRPGRATSRVVTRSLWPLAGPGWGPGRGGARGFRPQAGPTVKAVFLKKNKIVNNYWNNVPNLTNQISICSEKQTLQDRII